MGVSSFDKKSISIFSHLKRSSSSFDKEDSRKPIKTLLKEIITPNPDNYEILRHQYINDCLIIELQYKDCTNYEGRKILVFRECTLLDLKKQGVIDPHFSENKEYLSPIARFEPTDGGWVNAYTFVKSSL